MRIYPLDFFRCVCVSVCSQSPPHKREEALVLCSARWRRRFVAMIQREDHVIILPPAWRALQDGAVRGRKIHRRVCWAVRRLSVPAGSRPDQELRQLPQGLWRRSVCISELTCLRAFDVSWNILFSLAASLIDDSDNFSFGILSLYGQERWVTQQISLVRKINEYCARVV